MHIQDTQSSAEEDYAGLNFNEKDPLQPEQTWLCKLCARQRILVRAEAEENTLASKQVESFVFHD